MRYGRWFVLGLCLLAAGCAVAPYRVGAFQPYVQRFEAFAAQYGRAVRIERLVIEYGVTIPETAVASCYILPWSPPHVSINREQWATIDPACRELYLFHELGHCILHRRHDERVAADGLPASMMGYRTLPCDLYRAHRDRYLRELFGTGGRKANTTAGVAAGHSSSVFDTNQ